MKIPTHKAEDMIDTYRKGGEDDVTHLYPELCNYLVDLHQCTYDDILLLDWQCAETCIYIKGDWSGYVSDVERELGSGVWREWDIDVDKAIARMKKYADNHPFRLKNK